MRLVNADIDYSKFSEESKVEVRKHVVLCAKPQFSGGSGTSR